jgi:hypothetical protein
MIKFVHAGIVFRQGDDGGVQNKLSQCLAVGGCHPPFSKYLLKLFLKPLSSFAGGNFGEGCVFVFQRNELPLIGFFI